jgi:hypothetical protein
MYTYNSSGTWSTPVAIATGGMESVKLSVDSSGNWHIVYVDDDDLGNFAIKYRNKYGGFSNIATGDVWGPDIATDLNGGLHVTYLTYNEPYSSIMYTVTLFREQITRIGFCPPSGNKNPIWGRFGPRSILESDSGEKLELVCESGMFQLKYTYPSGQKKVIGLCPFYGGCNSGWFYHTGDKNGNGWPDSFIMADWTSKDYGENDIPNQWTGELFETDLDWAVCGFRVSKDELIKISRKWEYATPPPIECPTSSKPEGRYLGHRIVEPPIWPQDMRLSSLPVIINHYLEEDSCMASDRRLPCDLDADGDCDINDLQIFQNALGSCEGEPNFIPEADDDLSGCIDEFDLHFLFVEDEDADGIPNSGDNCPFMKNPEQEDTDGDGIGDICQADINNDGKIDVFDLALLGSKWMFSDCGDCAGADIDHDGNVDINDLSILAKYWLAGTAY